MSQFLFPISNLAVDSLTFPPEMLQEREDGSYQLKIVYRDQIT